MSDRYCVVCGAAIENAGPRALYCKRACSDTAARRRAVNKNLASHQRTYRRVMSNPESAAARREYDLNTKQRIRQWLSDYKSASGCVDCGFNLHPSALQLDHESTKTASISELRSSTRRMAEEIVAGECVVRCASCHSIKTWCERNGLDYYGWRISVGVPALPRIPCPEQIAMLEDALNPIHDAAVI